MVEWIYRVSSKPDTENRVDLARYSDKFNDIDACQSYRALINDSSGISECIWSSGMIEFIVPRYRKSTYSEVQ